MHLELTFKLTKEQTTDAVKEAVLAVHGKSFLEACKKGYGLGPVYITPEGNAVLTLKKLK
jgi:hypothetical protein